ncbi:MAG: methyl-accepting chemotaxis protein [Myxococcaceae bacterium]
MSKKPNQTETELTRYRSAIDGVSTNLMIADSELRITFLNRSLMQMLSRNEARIRQTLPQFSAQGLIGRCIDDFHRDPSHQRRILQALDKEHKTRLQLAGLSFDLCVTPARGPTGQNIGFAVEWKDVTDELKAAAERARLEAEMQGHVGVMKAISASQATIEFTPEGVVLTANDNFCKTMGYRLEEVVGKHHRTFCDPTYVASDEYTQFWAKLGRGEFVGGTFARFARGNRPVHLQATYNPVTDASGKVIKVIKLATDITASIEEQKGAQAEVERVLASSVAGDLTQRMDASKYSGFVRVVSEGMNKLLDSMTDSMRQVRTAVEQIGQASTQLRATSQMMSSSSVELNNAAAESGKSLVKAADMSRSNADNAAMANQLVSQTSKGAQGGQSRMEEMMTSMSGINSSAQQIAKIIKVIDEIAFQTNLLALNAAVEAARAGRHGKGFAVVAQEVRNLAERSAKAAKETAVLIEDSVSKVGEGVKIAEATRDALKDIVTNVGKVVDLVGEIASASGEQSQTIRTVTDSVKQVTEGAQAGSQQSTEVAAAAEEMSRQMEILKQHVEHYKLSVQRAAAAQPGAALPAGLSQDVVDQVMRLINAQPNAAAFARPAAPAPAARPEGSTPRSVLPLDHDERGFKGF